MKNLKFVTPVLSLGVLTLTTLTANAAGFTAGDIVIYRVGDGAQTLASTGNSVFLDEYTPTGTLVQSIALPTAASGANKALVASGTATSEGQLNLSADGQYLALTGYNSAPVAASSLPGSTAATVSRTVGIVRGDGSVDTTTSLSNFADKNNPRAAYTADGTNIYVTGATGTAYTTVGSTSVSSTGALSTVNSRYISVANGQLYYSTGSGTTGIYSLGSGLPTSGAQTSTLVQASGSPYAFAFANLSGGTAPDTLYIADDGANSSGTKTPGITKFSLVNGTWVSKGTVGATNTFRGLTASVTGSTVNLFATDGAKLYSLTDTSGFNGALSGTATSIATAAANEAFRGLAFAPQTIVAATPAPSSLLVALVGVPGVGLLIRRRKAAK